MWEKYPEAMQAALAKHDVLLKEAIESNHGAIIKTTGDGVHAAFDTALDAINTTVVFGTLYSTTQGALCRVLFLSDW